MRYNCNVIPPIKQYVLFYLMIYTRKKDINNTILFGGSLRSGFDEERSKMRYFS